MIYSRKKNVDKHHIKLAKWKDDMKEWEKDPQILIDLRAKIAKNKEESKILD